MKSVVHGKGDASGWVKRWSHLVPVGGTVLDVACGHGRHMLWFAQRGHAVTGVDRSPEAIDAVHHLGVSVLADIETGPWPLVQCAHGTEGTQGTGTPGTTPRTFDAVIVTNYLWRPLLPTIARSLAPGGVLIYETFASGNESVGKPARPDFLLRPGELLRAFDTLRVVAYEEGFIDGPARFVQRLTAVSEETGLDPAPTPGQYPRRYPL